MIRHVIERILSWGPNGLLLICSFTAIAFCRQISTPNGIVVYQLDDVPLTGEPLQTSLLLFGLLGLAAIAAVVAVRMVRRSQ